MENIDGKIVTISDFIKGSKHEDYQLDNLEVVDVEIDGVDMHDYPNFIDAYIESAKFESSGKELSEVQLEKLKEQNIDEFYQDVMDKVYEYADMCSN
jgi:hypothetical protein